jgi:hypothetical protein
LRFEDLNENLEILKSEKIKKDYKIGEKHQAISTMISSKREFLSTANDRWI